MSGSGFKTLAVNLVSCVFPSPKSKPESYINIITNLPHRPSLHTSSQAFPYHKLISPPQAKPSPTTGQAFPHHRPSLLIPQAKPFHTTGQSFPHHRPSLSHSLPPPQAKLPTSPNRQSLSTPPALYLFAQRLLHLVRRRRGQRPLVGEHLALLVLLRRHHHHAALAVGGVHADEAVVVVVRVGELALAGEAGGVAEGGEEGLVQGAVRLPALRRVRAVQPQRTRRGGVHAPGEPPSFSSTSPRVAGRALLVVGELGEVEGVVPLHAGQLLLRLALGGPGVPPSPPSLPLAGVNAELGLGRQGHAGHDHEQRVHGLADGVLVLEHADGAGLLALGLAATSRLAAAAFLVVALQEGVHGGPGCGPLALTHARGLAGQGRFESPGNWVITRSALVLGPRLSGAHLSVHLFFFSFLSALQNLASQPSDVLKGDCFASR